MLGSEGSDVRQQQRVGGRRARPSDRLERRETSYGDSQGRQGASWGSCVCADVLQFSC